jgi:maleate isomerase
MSEPARVGLIIPSSNRQVEQEMVRWYPADVQPHVNRLRMTGPHAGPLAGLLPRITEAAAELNDARCATIIFHCTANSMQGGASGEEQVRAALRAGATGRVATTAGAVRNALDAVGARRIVLIVPQDADAAEHEAAFMRAAGYDVVAVHALDMDGSDAYCAAPSSFWYDAVARARTQTDAYFLSCANIGCFEVVEALEAALDRPVITSNQAVLWEGVRHAGSTAPMRPLGRLFHATAAPV